MDSLKTSNLHISAIVQIGKISTNIDLYELANNLVINNNILYIEYGSEISKGDNLKKKLKRKKN